jgi:hypothetical protein
MVVVVVGARAIALMISGLVGPDRREVGRKRHGAHIHDMSASLCSNGVAVSIR